MMTERMKTLGMCIEHSRESGSENEIENRIDVRVC